MKDKALQVWLTKEEIAAVVKSISYDDWALGHKYEGHKLRITVMKKLQKALEKGGK